VCVLHEHCPGNQHCQPDEQLGRNLCQEPEFCADDADCLGLRVCSEGHCQAPPECADDHLAGNGSAAEAALVEPGRYPDLVRCDRLDDWFGVALLAGQGLVASATFAEELDLSLALFAPDDPFVPLLLSDGAHGAEQVRLGVAPVDGVYALRVSGRQGHQGPYTLEVQVEEGFCAPDRLEAGPGNDDPIHASPLALGEQELVGLSLCPGDVDWFALPVGRPSDGRWEVLAAVEGLQLAVARADAPEQALATGEQVEPGRFELTAELEAAPHVLRIEAPVGPLGVVYDLRASLRTSAAHLAERCEAATLLEDGTPAQGATTDEPPDFMPSCAAPGHLAPEALYQVHMETPGSLRVRLLQADFDAVVSLRSDCLVAASELACGHLPALLYVPELGAGDYIVSVDGYSDEAGTFEIVAERDVPGRLPGDGCAEPLPVALSVGSEVELAGDTISASATFAPRRCGDLADAAAGRDLVYRLEVLEPLELSAQASGDGWQPLLALYGETCGQEELRCALDASIAHAPLAAGTYHLVVDGRDRFGSGPFSLTLAGGAPALPPANDSCLAPTLLAVDELPAAVHRSGTTTAASADYAAGCGLGEPDPGGGDVVFELQLSEPAALRAWAVTDHRHILKLVRGPCEQGELLACQSDAALEPGVVPAGEYFLFLSGWSAEDAGPFDLELSLEPPPSPCAQQALLVAGEVFEGDTERQTTAAAGSCGGAGPERAHRLVLEEPAQVRIAVAADFDDPVLHLRSSCDAADSELLCAAGGAPLVHPALPAGEYAVFVDSDAAVGGRYLLDVRRSAPSLAPPHDHCAAAEFLALPADGEPLVLNGTTLHARADIGSECGELGEPDLGPDVFYRFELAVRAEVEAVLNPEFDAVVTLRSDSCDAGAELGCVDAFGGESARVARRLDPGSYLLVVTGMDAGAVGPFGLTLSATPEGDLPHSCDEPALIEPNAPRALDNTGGIDTLWPSCTPDGGVGEPESVLRFRLVEPRSVRVRLLDTVRTGSLSLRGDCWQADTELACTAGRTLEVGTLPAGTYFVVADGLLGWDGEPAPYSLLLETGPPDGAPPGDTCPAALPVELAVPGSTELVGEPAGLSDALPAACGPAGAPDRIWRLEVAEPSVLDAWFEAPYAAVLSLTAGPCGVGQELGCGPTLQGVRLPAGTHYLALQVPPGAQGGYALTLDARALPANDGCAQPELLVFEDDVARANASLELATDGAAAQGCDLAGPTGVGPELAYELRLPQPAQIIAQAQGQGGVPPALYLRAANCAAGPELACGLGTLDSDDTLSAGTYYLFVDAGDGAPGPAGLTVRRFPVAPPANDVCNTATPIDVPPAGGLVQLNGSLAGARPHYLPGGDACPPDSGRGADVVYVVDLAEPMSLRATVRAQYDAVVYLSEPCGAADALACAGGDGWLRAGPLQAGRHYLVVDGPVELGAAAGFQLEVELTPLPANDDCADPVTLSLDDAGGASVAGDTRLALSRFSAPGCGGAGAADLTYMVDLAEPSDLLVQVVGDLDPVVHLHGERCGESLLSCFAPPHRLLALPAGRYHLIVDGAQEDEAGAFELQVQAAPAVPRPLDTKCTQAPTLDLGPGTVTVVGHSGGADALLASPGCPEETAAAPERIFRLDLQRPASLSVGVEHSDHPLVVSVLGPDRLPPRAACSQHTELACGGGAEPINELALEPEEYFLVVDGAGVDGPGAFRLAVSLGETVDERCQAARWLLPGPDGVLFAGSTAGAGDVLRPLGCGDTAREAGTGDAVMRFAFDERMALAAEVVFAETPLAVSVRAMPCGGDLEAGCGLAAAGELALSGLVLEPGEYVLSVDGAEEGAEGAFELLVSAVPHRLAEEKCATAPEVRLGPDTPSVPIEGDTAAEDARFVPLGCAPEADPAAPESMYRVVMAAEGLLSVNVTASEQPASAYVLGVTPGQECDAAPELACGVGATPLHQIPLPAGEAFVVLDGAAAAGPGAHGLTFRWEPTPEAKCAAAEQLILDGAELLVEGDSTGASGVFEPSQCGADIDGVGPEVVYDLWLPEGRLVTLDLQRSDNPAVAYLRAPCTGAQDLLCAALGQPAESQFLPAGHYGLVVDGHAGQGPGSFSLQLLAAVQGDTCDAPLELWGGAGTLSLPGTTNGAQDDLQTAGCGFATDGPDQVFLLDLPGLSDVDLELQATPGFPEPNLYVLQDCDAPEASLACGTPASAAQLRGLQAGSYYVVVDSAAAPAPYSLDLRVSDLPAACDGAGRLPVGVPIDGLTSGETDSVLPSCAGPVASPDRVYRLVLEQAAAVTLELEAEDFDPVLAVLDDCSLDASELACRTGSGRLHWSRLAAGEYFVVVDGQQGGSGRYLLTLRTAPPLEPAGGDGCEGAHAVDPVSAGGTLDLFGSLQGRQDSFGFCDVPAAPDASYALDLPRPLDLRLSLRPYDEVASLTLVPEQCHDGRAPQPWPPALGEPLLCQEVPASPFVLTRELERVPAGRYTVVVDGALEGASFDYDLHLEALEQSTLYAPLLTPGQPSGATLVGQPDRFPSDCGAGAAPEGPEGVHRVYMAEGQATLRVAVSEASFTPSVAIYTHPLREAGARACATEANLDHERLWSGGYAYVVVSSLDGLLGEYTLQVAVEQGEQ